MIQPSFVLRSIFLLVLLKLFATLVSSWTVIWNLQLTLTISLKCQCTPFEIYPRSVATSPLKPVNLLFAHLLPLVSSTVTLFSMAATQSLIHRLQRIQIYAACLIVRIPKYSHITLVLKALVCLQSRPGLNSRYCSWCFNVCMDKALHHWLKNPTALWAQIRARSPVLRGVRRTVPSPSADQIYGTIYLLNFKTLHRNTFSKLNFKTFLFKMYLR